ncbi:hypothetical protein [Microbaculum marinum]|uniref:DUF1574 domain-containing protein n=1 Tax=Microbaculum marinum TaxID=1764581 RepID=A0AAW9RWM5_9HYPH
MNEPHGQPPAKEPAEPDLARQRVTRKGRWLAAFAVAAALLCAAILLPETRYLRYADEFRELADPIFCDDRDIDVLFLGSSRMARSVDGFSIASAYREMTGEDLTIVDLSKTGPSDAVMDILLADLLKRRHVRLIVAEMSRPRMGLQWKILEKMGRVMPLQDYYDYAEAASKHGSIGAFWDALQLRMAFLEGGLSKPWPGCPPQSQQADVIDPTLALPKREDVKKISRRIERKGLRPFYPNFLNNVMAYQMNMAHSAIDLARNNGAEIIFMSVNTLHDRQVSKEQRQEFSDKFGTELSTWSPDLYKFLREQSLYSDSSHLDEDGARLAAAWYAEKIREYLADNNEHPAPDNEAPADARS